MGGIVILLVLIAVAVFLFYASYSIGSGIYVKALCRGKTDKRTVCLTFDDGPDETYTPRVLDILREYQAPATFFCIGEKAESQRQLLKRMRAEGHLIGNHTFTHSWKFPFYSVERMREEIRRTDGCLKGSGQASFPFRPPFGVTNPTIARVVRENKLPVVGWSIRSFDTRGESEETVFRRIVRQIQPGAVILLHDRMPGCASLLARLLEYLDDADYRVVPLNEMFDIPNLSEDEKNN